MLLIIRREIVLSSLFFITYVAESKNYQRDELTDEEYIYSLVKCQSDIARFKWSKNIWPKVNKTPKPPFESIFNKMEIKNKVLGNLKMQSALAVRFNINLYDQMLQHDINRMTANTEDDFVLKQIFAHYENNPIAITQCISVPYLNKNKTQSSNYWNIEIELSRHLIKKNARVCKGAAWVKKCINYSKELNFDQHANVK